MTIHKFFFDLWRLTHFSWLGCVSNAFDAFAHQLLPGQFGCRWLRRAHRFRTEWNPLLLRHWKSMDLGIYWLCRFRFPTEFRWRHEISIISVISFVSLNRNQRLVVEFDSVHRRAIHRHLSSDESPKRLHCQTCKENRGRCLGICFLLFITLARTHRHWTHPLQRISNSGTMRHETLPSRISGDYYFNSIFWRGQYFLFVFGLVLQGYFFADIVVFYLVPLLLSCVLYGLIARVLFNGHFNKYPEVCRHDNQSSVDPTKSSRVQVRFTIVFILIGGVIFYYYYVQNVAKPQLNYFKQLVAFFKMSIFTYWNRVFEKKVKWEKRRRSLFIFSNSSMMQFRLIDERPRQNFHVQLI